ncbi:MAG: dTMP kinase [Candidatus Bathyarchaeota archaeon]|nr:dTMP kinase [Candidatus Bathyarchaeota archaeon]
MEIVIAAFLIGSVGGILSERGFFVCIEGLDKSGKTTQSCLLVRDLYRRGFKSFYTTEPSRGEIGRFIRKHVLSRRKRVPAAVEALLFAADRYDHSEREIKPMLKNGMIVVSDRYVYSSLAYQGAAGLDLDWIKKINKFSPVPDLAIYVDAPLEVLAKRIRSHSSVMERVRTQMMVRNVYLELVRHGELIRVDGNRPVNEVSKEILDLVLSRLKHEG